MFWNVLPVLPTPFHHGNQRNSWAATGASLRLRALPETSLGGWLPEFPGEGHVNPLVIFKGSLFTHFLEIRNWKGLMDYYWFADFSVMEKTYISVTRSYMFCWCCLMAWRKIPLHTQKLVLVTFPENYHFSPRKLMMRVDGISFKDGSFSGSTFVNFPGSTVVFFGWKTYRNLQGFHQKLVTG